RRRRRPERPLPDVAARVVQEEDARAGHADRADAGPGARPLARRPGAERRHAPRPQVPEVDAAVGGGVRHTIGCDGEGGHGRGRRDVRRNGERREREQSHDPTLGQPCYGCLSRRFEFPRPAGRRAIMGCRVRRSRPILALLALGVLTLGAAESAADRSAGATARAWAIRVVVPGQPGAGTRVLTAPDDAFAYPADGSIVAAASVTTSVSASSSTEASAGATSQVTTLSLFKGEITADS